MQLARSRLTVLLNALYDSGETTIPVSHPGSDVGELFRIELGGPQSSTVRLSKDFQTYSDARSAVNSSYGAPAVNELPSPRSYLSAFLAGGLLSPGNDSEIADFLDRYGNPDLNAGADPVLAGFDTNIMPWRPAHMLGLRSTDEPVINGFALATGIRDELDWGGKRKDTQSLVEAFGPEFEALWNQPAGASREGRLGELCYRQLRDQQYGDEFTTDTGDEEIIEGYDEYERETRKEVLLFSNDRDFIERARSHRIHAQRVEFPEGLPRKLTGSWQEIQDTLYLLSILFGVLTLPKVTLYGVWKGKGGMAWHDEKLEVDCRSPKVEPLIKRDNAIIEAHDQ
ncbi:hypothetical protein [Halococcus sediminicola]|uniref:hypothetical protein n=1 Tax=Halococcus sediminicola TaxID=1264579 RepID=UPI000679DE2F|nr:hypothetical protein [Halococcus sediminicola]